MTPQQIQDLRAIARGNIHTAIRAIALLGAEATVAKSKATGEQWGDLLSTEAWIGGIGDELEAALTDLSRDLFFAPLLSSEEGDGSELLEAVSA